jgi:hypothetical protein
MHTSPTCLNFSKKSAPGITSDVATRRVVLERVPKGHRHWQRRWPTTPMVSIGFTEKNIGVRNASFDVGQ